MKNILILVLTLASVTGHAATWKKPLFCGNYKSTQYGDISKYGVKIGAAKDARGIERELELYKNHSDGSNLIEEGYGCQKNGSILTCVIGNVRVDLDTNQKPNLNSYYIYNAKITVPTLFGSKIYDGSCSLYHD